MKFFRSFLASFLAVIAAILIGIPLIFIFVGGLIASFNKTPEIKVPNHAVLEMKLNGPIVENASTEAEPFKFDELSTFGISTNKLGLYQIVASIENAAKDDRVDGIYLHLGPGVQTGWANLKSIRDALIDFQNSGKFIYAYSEVFTENTYYLASVADSVFMAPEGIMEFNGLVASPTFYAGLFEKIDLQPKIFKVGTYKSAVEPYIRKDMSEANKEQTSIYLGDIWNTFLEEVSTSRNMSRSDLDQKASQFIFGDGKSAARQGLIDRTAHEHEILSLLAQASDQGDAKPQTLSFAKYMRVPAKKERLATNRIAVIFAEGAIQSGKSTDGVIGSQTVVEQLRKAREDDNVKAVVFRINSPGGSALASDVIAEEVRLTSEEKPIVASFGNVAASGGYYIAAKCDHIFAQPNTITGSIGIFAILYDAKAAINNNLGITFDAVETNESANFGNPFFPMTPAEEALLQRYVERGYGSFIETVRSGRDFADSAAVDKVGQGRVWSGLAAIDINLVDEMGDLSDAIAYAAQQAGLGDDYMMRLLPKPKNVFEELMETMTETTIRGNVPMYDEMQELEKLKQRIPRSGMYMLMPEMEIR